MSTPTPHVPAARDANPNSARIPSPVAFMALPVNTALEVIPAAMNNAAMPNIIHPSGEPSTRAHTSRLTPIRRLPGNTGTIMPTAPTTMARPQTTVQTICASILQWCHGTVIEPARWSSLSKSPGPALGPVRTGGPAGVEPVEILESISVYILQPCNGGGRMGV